MNITKKYYLYNIDDINPSSVAEAISFLDENSSEDREVPPLFILNSHGGEVPSAIHLMRVIQNYHKPVSVLALENVLSAALEIFLSVPLKNRYAYKFSEFWSHKMQHSFTTADGPICSVTDKVNIKVKRTREAEKIYNHYFKKYRIIPKKFNFDRVFTDTEKVYTANQLVKMGLILKGNIL